MGRRRTVPAATWPVADKRQRVCFVNSVLFILFSKHCVCTERDIGLSRGVLAYVDCHSSVPASGCVFNWLSGLLVLAPYVLYLG